MFSRRYVLAISLAVCLCVVFFTSFDEPILFGGNWLQPSCASVSKHNNISTANQTEELALIAPPQGYPWQHWSHSSIDIDRMIESLEREENIEACVRKNAKKNYFRICNLQWHNQVIVIRNGTVCLSRIRMERLRETQPQNVERIIALEQMLHAVVDVAKKYTHVDTRFQQIAHGNIPLLLYNGDFTGCFPAEPVLAWSMTASQIKCADSWAIPSYHLWQKWGSKTQQMWGEQFEAWNKAYPWENKRPMAVWRGRPTGMNVTRWEDLPRVKLVQISMDNPHLIDAAFARFYKVWKDHKEDMKSRLRFEPVIPEEDFMKYRAIIDIDGNSWSSRFGDLLCFNAVVIKVQPNYVDYFYEELEPWKHYVPVNANLSNLEEIVQYIISEENDAEMQQVVRNANSWCRRKLVGTQLVNDLLWIMLSYVELLNKGDESWDEKWRENKKAHDMPSLQFEPSR